MKFYKNKEAVIDPDGAHQALGRGFVFIKIPPFLR